MPVEGQWARRNAPVRTLTGRERRAFLVLTIAVVLAAVIVVAWAATKGPTAAAGPGCVDEFAGSTMGGVRVQACGPDAARVCRRPSAPGAALAETLARACARAGYGGGRSG
ncbi:MAG: hypothetical protein QOG68_1696 [Solirubrobacteraceae bacterium]|jgi:hypothetical protein|nr:hypothetical protein [Solirubrobacteraceae bacterium]